MSEDMDIVMASDDTPIDIDNFHPSDLLSDTDDGGGKLTPTDAMMKSVSALVNSVEKAKQKSQAKSSDHNGNPKEEEDDAEEEKSDPTLFNEQQVPSNKNKFYRFRVPARYNSQKLEHLGTGSQGCAVKGYDDIHQAPIVIKKLRLNIDDIDLMDSSEKATRTKKLRLFMRELLLLNVIRHNQLLYLLDVYTPATSLEDFRTIYHVTEYRGISLKDFYKQYKHEADNSSIISKYVLREPSGLLHSWISYIVCQILRGVQYLHRANILHRDLKTNNIAIDSSLNVTILDMGLARRFDIFDGLATAKVGTKQYKAPELIFSFKDENYGKKADIWSIGSIMGELIRLKPVFKGERAEDVYSDITKKLGSPRDKDPYYERFRDHDKRQMLERKGRRGQDFNKLFPDKCFSDGAGKEPFTAKAARHLLEKMLAIKESDRWDADQCLSHDYVKQWATHKLPEFRPDVQEIIRQYDDTVELDRLTAAQWKERLFNFIQDFRKQHTP